MADDALRALVDAALDLPLSARDAFLERANVDASLRAAAVRWVAACERAELAHDFLAEPAGERAAPLLAVDAPIVPAPMSPIPAPAPDANAIDAPTTHDAALGSIQRALAPAFAVEREVGRGGTAAVYLARDVRHRRRVAVKVLHAELAAALGTGRFLREIEVTAELQHPHILPLFDSGSADGRLFFVMPFVEGETVRERLARDGRLPVGDVVRLMREVASALDYAHRKGVVHRDVKPANVLLVDGHAVVADFGIARAMRRARELQAPHEPPGDGVASNEPLTDAGTSPGTPGYMAPEQARCDASVDHRADLYALGVVAYEALAGINPFGARTPRALISAHLDEIPTPLHRRRSDVPPALAALVMRLLEKDPNARPQSAAEVIAALDTMGLDGATQAGDAMHDPRDRSRTRRVAVTVVLLVACVVLVIGVRALRSAAPPGITASTVAPESRQPAVSMRRAAGGSDGEAQGAATDVTRGTADQEAYELYLKGRYYWAQRGAANIERAIAFYRQAIARDPSFARAHAGLAMAYSTLPDFVAGAGDSTLALVSASAQRALALDSTLADAQLALGIALDARLEFQAALTRYRTAVASDPSSVTAHHWLGMSLLNLGRTDEAIVELSHATTLDPLAPTPASAFALALLYGRRFADARAAARHALTVDSTFVYGIWALGLAQTFGGMADSGVRTFERGMRLHPDDSRVAAGLTLAYAAAGRWADADRMRSRLHHLGADRSGWGDAELAELIFGDSRPFVNLLTTERDQRRYIASGALFGCNPVIDPLWSDTRFQRAMRIRGVERCRRARPWKFPARRGA